MDGSDGPAVSLGSLEGMASDPTARIEPAGADLKVWAHSEAELCAALVRQGKSGREVGPLIAAALRATDALSRRPLPAEARAMLKASALEALRTLACTDGRQRRRARSAA